MNFLTRHAPTWWLMRCTVTRGGARVRVYNELLDRGVSWETLNAYENDKLGPL